MVPVAVIVVEFHQPKGIGVQSCSVPLGKTLVVKADLEQVINRS